MPNASFIKRLLAIIYDFILIVALLMIASAIGMIFNDNQPVAHGNFLMLLWLDFVGFLYYGISWKISGQTLGLRTWRLRLIDNNGGSVSWQQVIARYFLGFIFFFSVIGFVWILFHPEKLSWYDILTKTKIINEKPRK